MTIAKFVAELSSKKPAPGGGSVAALVGSMAASLLAMVCNLTLGKRKYEQSNSEVRAIRSEAERLRDGLLVAANRDAEVFLALMACYRLSKNSTKEKEYRSTEIQKALRSAIEVPFETGDMCLEVIRLAKRLVAIGNKKVASDVIVAALMANAAVQSAIANVNINLMSVKDGDYIDTCRARRTQLSRQSSANGSWVVANA